MKNAPHILEIDGISVTVIRKDIRTMRLAVYPPDGRVRMSVPRRAPERLIRSAISERANWIRKQQEKIEARPMMPPKQYLSGDPVDIWGQRYSLEVVEQNASPFARLREDGVVELSVRPGATVARRAAVLNQWYRDEMHQRMPELVAKWEPVVGKRVAEVKTRWMKTRWGSCIIRDRRIWLNLELARFPEIYLEYVLVHEMVHLHERRHNDRFKRLMDKFMPEWREYRKVLKKMATGGEF